MVTYVPHVPQKRSNKEKKIDKIKLAPSTSSRRCTTLCTCVCFVNRHLLPEIKCFCLRLIHFHIKVLHMRVDDIYVFKRHKSSKIKCYMFDDWGHVSPVSTDNTCCFVDFIAVHHLFKK